MVNYYAYQALFEQTVQANPKIRSYEEQLEEKSLSLRITMLSTSVVTKLLHPVRLVRTQLCT